MIYRLCVVDASGQPGRVYDAGERVVPAKIEARRIASRGYVGGYVDVLAPTGRVDQCGDEEYETIYRAARS